MLFVFDQALKVIHTTADPKDLIAGEVNEQINGEHSCNLTIPWTADTQVKFAEFNHVGFYLNNRFEVYKIRQTTDIKKGDAERDLYCEHLSYELSDSIVEDKRIDNGPARDIITRILSDTEWEVGNIADLGSKTYNAYYITHREALYEIAELYGGELQFRIELDEEKKAIAHKYVDLLATRGEDTGIRFTFDRNLEEIQRDTDTLEIRTCLIGRGYSPETENGGQQRRIQFTDVIWRKADGYPVDKPVGQNWVGHPEAIAKYGMIKGVYEDESETPEQLLQNTWNALQKQCEKTQTYKAKLLFLQELMGDKKVLRLGDHFTIIDDEIGMTMNTRIIEIKYDLQDITNSEATMGQFYKTGGDDSDFEKLQTQIDNIRDTIGNIEIGDVSIDDGNFPNTVPPKSTVTTTGLFASIQIDWTYTNRTYYEYALYGSQTKGFAPAQQNLLYRGRGSSFLHSVQPDQTWYYRVCAYNSHGNRNEFSDEVKGYSAKIANAEDYMATASIGSALIGSLNADVINSGKIKAQHIEMKGVSVTDGNGTKTLDIDSAGQVSMNVSSLKIKNNSVATESFVSTAKNEAINSANDTINATIANYYTKTETDSQIDIAKNAITSSVSSTYETKTEVANKINAIQVGGTNLFPNTKTLESGVSSTSYIISETYLGLKVMRCNNTSGSYIDAYRFNSLINVEPNTEYTLSFYAKGNGTFISFFYPNNVSTGIHSNGSTTTANDGSITTTVTSSWKRYWITWKTASNASGLKNVIISRVHSGADIYICGAKFEKGNKASEWSPCPDDIETTVSTIERRVSTAESKITDEAITNTVKKNFYTKSETENAITSKNYATQSQVQQTAENIEFKFTQTGGYNLIRNGNPKPWHEENWWVSGNGRWYRGNPNDIGIQTDSTNEAYVGTANFKVEPGMTYSVSCWLMAEVNTKGTDVYFIGSANDDGAYTQIQHIYNGSGDGVWRQVKGTFTVGSNINYGFIRIDNNGRKDTSIVNYNVVFFSEVQMVKGSECYPQWSPNPNEIYDGITTIDKDGVKVVHGDSYSRLGAHGLMRYDGNVGKYYHYLSYMGQVDLASEERVTIQLPSEFRNRDFKVIVSVKRVRMNYDPYAEKHLLMGFYAEVNSIDTANATFEVYASVRAIKSTNFNGSITGADYGHDTLRPVVAYWVYA